MMTEPD
jgi:hypothetical protein